MTRIDRLRASLEEPLLVTNGVNVRYLVGFSSSNAALFVEPERVRLFSDFRYAEAARAVEGVEFVETKRSLVAALAELLEGSVGFEADAVSYSSWEVLRAGGLALVPRRGLVETLRAVKDDGELDAIRRAGEITSEAYARLAEERFVGRSERELAWRLDELFHEHGADAPAFETIVASGPNSAKPHARPTDRTIEAGETVVVDAGAMVDGYNADCTRTFATGPLPDELKTAYAATLEAPARRPRSDEGRGHRRRRRRRGARRRSKRPASARTSATASGTASGSRCTRRRDSPASPATRSRPATWPRSSRVSTSKAGAGSGSRTW